MNWQFGLSWLLLAEGDGKAAAPAPGPFEGLTQMLPLIVGIVFLFYFLMLRPQKRERQQRQMMLDALKKNDRVLTIGGVYGVVLNVHREIDEVTVRVDEATNTKLRITLGSIARVIPDDVAAGKEDKTS